MTTSFAELAFSDTNNVAVFAKTAGLNNQTVYSATQIDERPYGVLFTYTNGPEYLVLIPWPNVSSVQGVPDAASAGAETNVFTELAFSGSAATTVVYPPPPGDAAPTSYTASDIDIRDNGVAFLDPTGTSLTFVPWGNVQYIYQEISA